MIYKKDKKAFSIMLIDIDNFRKVNENFGYIAGDKILIDIAYELKKLVRDTDILARWAGEEFIILLPDTDHIAAKHVAEKINTHMKKCDFTVDECGECSITCSIIMTSSKDGDDENTIIKRVESHIQDVANKENIFIEI
jgi:diguanylate cyclase (GGDEF)-like protein